MKEIISQNKIRKTLKMVDEQTITDEKFEGNTVIDNWMPVDNFELHYYQNRMNDSPGCYVFLTWPDGIKNRSLSNYEGVYVGRSEKVLNRIRDNIHGGGNGEVYHDCNNHRLTYVGYIKCKKEQLTDLETILGLSYPEDKRYYHIIGGGKHCRDTSKLKKVRLFIRCFFFPKK